MAMSRIFLFWLLDSSMTAEEIIDWWENSDGMKSHLFVFSTSISSASLSSFLMSRMAKMLGFLLLSSSEDTMSLRDDKFTAEDLKVMTSLTNNIISKNSHFEDRSLLSMSGLIGHFWISLLNLSFMLFHFVFTTLPENQRIRDFIVDKIPLNFRWKKNCFRKRIISSR